MTTKDHFIFLLVGAFMLALPQLAPAEFLPADHDGFNGSEVWLACMGTLQSGIGMYGLYRRQVLALARWRAAQLDRSRRALRRKTISAWALWSQGNAMSLADAEDQFSVEALSDGPVFDRSSG